jgi:hypothetical protein
VPEPADVGRTIDVERGVRQFDGDDLPGRIAQQFARTLIAAKAPHGPEQAARQHRRRSEHAPGQGRNDRAGPGPRSRRQQYDIGGSECRLVGEDDECRAGGPRQCVDAGHQRAREPLSPFPVQDDLHGHTGQLLPQARCMRAEDDDAAGGLARERDATGATQQRLGADTRELLGTVEAARPPGCKQDDPRARYHRQHA